MTTQIGHVLHEDEFGDIVIGITKTTAGTETTYRLGLYYRKEDGSLEPTAFGKPKQSSQQIPKDVYDALSTMAAKKCTHCQATATMAALVLGAAEPIYLCRQHGKVVEKTLRELGLNYAMKGCEICGVVYGHEADCRYAEEEEEVPETKVLVSFEEIREIVEAVEAAKESEEVYTAYGPEEEGMSKLTLFGPRKILNPLASCFDFDEV